MQYIDLRDRFSGDIFVLHLLMKCVSFMHPKFNLAWILDVNFEDDFWNCTHSEKSLFVGIKGHVGSRIGL